MVSGLWEVVGESRYDLAGVDIAQLELPECVVTPRLPVHPVV